jgi:hypothetical protein
VSVRRQKPEENDEMGVMAQKRARRARGWAEMDFAALSGRARGLFRGGLSAACAAAGLALLTLLLTAPDLLLPFVAIVAPALAGLAWWAWTPGQGLPLLPIFLVQQGLIYGLPVALQHPEAAEAGPGILLPSALSVGLFLACAAAGWRGGREMGSSKPSRGNIVLGGTAGRSMSLAFTLLGAALAFYLATRTGLLFKLLPGPLAGLFPIIRTFAIVASMLGAMLGGLAVGGHPNHLRSWIYWGLLAAIGLLAVADVLLSGASGILLSAAVGLALGMRRVPWKFLTVTFLLVGFLNQGKFVMRERYWQGAEQTNTTAIGLLDLPGFFAEWTEASGSLLFGGDQGTAAERPLDDDGQSILDRINNIQNMTFVVGALDQGLSKPLWGQTYALIPPLLVPRVLWPDKPRAHEGQILLNLHFGRQATVEQTERTYIAWGLLPEAVGNFGVWFGAIIGGLGYGFLIGWTERISCSKRLLSIEGMLLAALMLLVAGSYEMVASVFVTATFQALVAAAVGGWLLRMWFGAAPKRSGMTQQRTKRMGHGAERTENASPLTTPDA